jgi:hypothetical protein
MTMTYEVVWKPQERQWHCVVDRWTTLIAEPDKQQELLQTLAFFGLGPVLVKTGGPPVAKTGEPPARRAATPSG